MPRLSEVGDAAFILIGDPLTGASIRVLHGETHFTISSGLKPVPYKDWKATRTAMADLAKRAVSHLPESPRTPSPTPPLPPAGSGRWCCADGSAANGPQPPVNGHARYEGDGFTVAIPRPRGQNESADKGEVQVKLFGPAGLDPVLFVSTAHGEVTADPADLRKDGELDMKISPWKRDYRLIGLTPLTYRGGRAVDWEGTYRTGLGFRTTMHFRTRLFILPDGRQWMIHANGRQQDFARTLPYFEAALRTFTPTPPIA